MSQNKNHCTVVEGGFTSISGKDGTVTSHTEKVEHQVKLGQNLAVATSVINRQSEGPTGKASSLTKGVEGSYKGDYGVSGVKFTDRTVSNGDRFTDTTLSHGLRPTDNTKLTGTLGLSNQRVGGQSASGYNLGLKAENFNKNLGDTTVSLMESKLSGGGINHHHTSGSLRHDFPLTDATKVGASVSAGRHDLGNFVAKERGFGLHGQTTVGSGQTTSLDVTRSTSTTPQGPHVVTGATLGHRVPVGNDAFVGSFLSHNHHQTPFGNHNSNAFGFNFGFKF